MELKETVMEQMERVRRMEQYLEKGRKAVAEFATALEQWEQVQAGIRELDAYYGSPMWFQDLEDDAMNKFPVDLKRGVLSQDLVYELLMENQTLKKKISEMGYHLKNKESFPKIEE